MKQEDLFPRLLKEAKATKELLCSMLSPSLAEEVQKKLARDSLMFSLSSSAGEVSQALLRLYSASFAEKAFYEEVLFLSMPENLGSLFVGSTGILLTIEVSSSLLIEGTSVRCAADLFFQHPEEYKEALRAAGKLQLFSEPSRTSEVLVCQSS